MSSCYFMSITWEIAERRKSFLFSLWSVLSSLLCHLLDLCHRGRQHHSAFQHSALPSSLYWSFKSLFLMGDIFRTLQNAVSFVEYTASNVKRFYDWDTRSNLEGAARVLMEVLIRYFSGGTEEYDDNCQSGYSVTQSRFEQDIFQINYDPYLTQWSRVLPEKLTGVQLIRNSPHFMEPEGSSPHSQEPTTFPCPEPDRFSPCPTILLLEDPFQYYPPI